MERTNEFDFAAAGFSSPESALEPATFVEADIAEKQLFMTPWQMIARRFFGNRLAVAGLVTLILMALFCYVMPLAYPYSESELFYIEKETGIELRSSGNADRIGNSLLSVLAPMSKTHWLGTNRMGQDMLARLMYGGRISLMVGFVVVIVELLIGVILGGIAGYYGGFISTIIMRLADAVTSIPTMPLLLIISSLLISLRISPAHKIYYTMFVLGFLYWTGPTRLVRGNILSLREMEFMQAATATGIRPRNQIFRHLVPNTLPNLIVLATLHLGGIILLESTMSFLGVGVGIPYASWGNMVSEVSDSIVMRLHPNIWVAPGLCILITVLAFNFVGDGLRDATDPRMKR